MKVQVCPICCSKNSKWDLCKNGYDIYKCDHCDHFFVYPMPNYKQLVAIYSVNAGYHSTKNPNYSDIQSVDNDFINQLNKTRCYVKTGIVLDVGCSNGEFLALARDYGYTIQGVELNESTATIAQHHGIPVSVGTLEQAHFPSNIFDIIRLGDIIEHVTDVKAFMTEVHRILKPGGFTMIITPNHDAFFPKSTYLLSKLLGITWSHPTPPHHLNQFSPTSITILMDQMNFNIKEFYYSGCSLKYEIAMTYVIKEFRYGMKNKSYAKLPKYMFNLLTVVIGYSFIWLVDKILFLKKQDFNMSTIVTK